MNALGVKSSHKLQRALGMKHASRIHALGNRQNPAITDFSLGESPHLDQIFKHASNSGDNTYLPLGLKHRVEKIRVNGLERKHHK